jgi:hypothetical protein
LNDPAPKPDFYAEHGMAADEWLRVDPNEE